MRNPAIWQFISSQEDELTTENNMSMPECILHFLHSVLFIFQKYILTFEKRHTDVTSVYDLTKKFRDEFVRRKNDEFYGWIANQNLSKLEPYEQRNFKKNANLLYSRLLTYLDKWIDPDNSFFKLMRNFNIKHRRPSIEDFMNLSKFFKINVSGDEMYTELGSLNDILDLIDDDPVLDMENSMLWSFILKKSSLPNIQICMENILSIPVSNTYCERIFSIVKDTWTDKRNRLLIENVKAELICSENLKYDCNQFKSVIINNKKLLKSVISSEKYNFKK